MENPRILGDLLKTHSLAGRDGISKRETRVCKVCDWSPSPLHGGEEEAGPTPPLFDNALSAVFVDRYYVRS